MPKSGFGSGNGEGVQSILKPIHLCTIPHSSEHRVLVVVVAHTHYPLCTKIYP